MSLNHLRKGSITVPKSFIEEAAMKYAAALQRKDIPLSVDEGIVSSVIKRLQPCSFNNFLGETVSYLSANKCTEKHSLGQFGYLHDKHCENVPKVSLKMVLDQTYDGMAPSPYFTYAMLPCKAFSGRVNYLPEPLKVRSITTSPAWEFAAGKPFQNVIASSMKENPNLLFGRMVQTSDIENLIFRSLNYWTGLGYRKEDLVFISGDYDAATDNISPSTSCLIDNLCFKNGLLPDFKVPLHFDNKALMGLWGAMGKILEYLPIDGPRSTKSNWININVWFQEAINRTNGTFALVSELRSKLWSGREIRDEQHSLDFTQTFGQLMGDIKSFPVLCILNLSLWEDVCEGKTVMVNYGNGVIKKEYAPCLVNGDDFLTYCPRKVGDKWRSRTGTYNFTLSVGKTYESERLAVINSQPFYVRKKDLSVVKIEIPYVNLCMKQDRNMPLVGNLDMVIDLRNTNLRKRMFSLFLSMNRGAIASETRGGLLNLFIHRDLGGLGAKRQPGIKVKFTMSQRRVAYDCERRWKMGLKPAFTAIYDKRLIFRQVREKVKKITLRKRLRTEEKNDSQLSIENGYKSSARTRMIARDDWISRAGKPVTWGTYFYVPKHKSQLFRFISKIRHGIIPKEKDLCEFVRPIINVKEKQVNHRHVIDYVELARSEVGFEGIEPPDLFL